MKKLKLTAILVLILCLAAAGLFPVFAASKSNLSMTVSKTSVTIGDKITVTVKLNGEPQLANFTGGVNFDKTVFKVTSVSSVYIQVYDSELQEWSSRSIDHSSVNQANSKGAFGFTTVLSAEHNVKIKSRNAALCTIELEAIKSGTGKISLYEASGAVSDKTYAYSADPVPGSEVSITVKNAPVTITFDANGHGTAPKAMSVESGTKVKLSSLPDMTADGWEFEGWYTDSACTKKFADGTAVTSDITLYAKWSKAHEHTMVHTAAKAADCEHDGNIEYWTCSDCKKIYKDAAGKTSPISQASTVIKALGHDWDKGTVTKEPTCEDKGTTTFKCSRCGATKTEDIKALGHKWGEGTVTKEPTCTAKGSQTFTCSVCEKTKTEDIKALGHDWTKIEYTWNKDNTKVTANAVCSRDETHKLTETVSTVRTDSLTPCGQEGTATFKATFKNAAFKAQTKTVKVASVPHTLKHFDAEDVKCEQDGTIEYWYCTVCGKYFADSAAKKQIKESDTIVAAQGHDVQGPVWTWSDDLKSASMAFACTKCDYKETAEAKVTADGDLRTATAEMAGEVYRDVKRIPTEDSVAIDSAKNSSGIAVWVAIDDSKAEALNPEDDTATVVWQKQLRTTEEGSATVRLSVDGAGEGKEILVYRWTEGEGWKLVSEEKNAESVTVSVDGAEDIAIAVRPIKEDVPVDPVGPVDPGKNTPGDDPAPAHAKSRLLLYIGIGAAALIAVVLLIVFAGPKKGKHYK